MKISIYEAAVPTYLHTLGVLKRVLEKGLAHAEAKKFDPDVLAASRLYPDMLPLTRQVQIASDAAKNGAARLAGVEAPRFEDVETTLPQLITRVERTIDYLRSFKPEQFEGAEERIVTFKTPGTTRTFKGLVFLRHWSLPNLFFHATVAYALLRHNGVELGKEDFLGEIPNA